MSILLPVLAQGIAQFHSVVTHGAAAPHSQSGLQSTFGDGTYTWLSTGARTRTRRGYKTNPLQPFWLKRMEPAGFEKSARYWASSLSLPESPAAAAAASGAPVLLRSGAQKRKAARLAAAAKVVARRREKWRAAVRARYRKDPNHKRAAAKAAYAAAPDEKRALAKAAYDTAPDNKRALTKAASEVAFDAAPDKKRALARATYATAPEKKRALARAASKAAFDAAPDKKNALPRRERRVLFAELSSQGGRSTPTPLLFPTVVDAYCIAHARQTSFGP